MAEIKGKHTKGELECGEDAALWIGDIKICTIEFPMTFNKDKSININEDIAEANAEHLVLCWNSHDDLLAACELTYKRICKNGNWDDGCFYYHNTSASELEEPLDLLKAVIDKKVKKSK